MAEHHPRSRPAAARPRGCAGKRSAGRAGAVAAGGCTAGGGKGLHAVTLEKVAELAGLTKGALQYHFKSRKGLVDALYDQVISQLQQRMEGHRKADAGSPKEPRHVPI